MKHGNTYYLQITRLITNEYKSLSASAKVLFLTLKELEMRYTGSTDKQGYFYRTNEQLAEDAGLSAPTLKKAKKELKEAGLIDIKLGHYKYEDAKKSEMHFTFYKILV